MNLPMVLPISRISPLIRLCSSSGILQVMPFCSILFSLLFHWFSPFGQHKHTPSHPGKLSPTPMNIQGKKPSQTSQPTMPENCLKRKKAPPCKRRGLAAARRFLAIWDHPVHTRQCPLACSLKICTVYPAYVW